MKIEQVSITYEDVVELLTMEAGGFDYWAQIDYDEKGYIKTKEAMQAAGFKGQFADGYCYEEVLAYMIWHKDDGVLPVIARGVSVYDFEDEKHYPLTKENITQGFLLNAQNRPQDANLEEGDAETGDCILQYAIFGDIIYG